MSNNSFNVLNLNQSDREKLKLSPTDNGITHIAEIDVPFDHPLFIRMIISRNAAKETVLLRQFFINIETIRFFNLIGINIGTSSFTIFSDKTSLFVPGFNFQIKDSINNDDEYTVNSSSYDGTNTIIIVNETINNSTIQGYIKTFDEIIFRKRFIPSNGDEVIITTQTIFPWIKE